MIHKNPPTKIGGFLHNQNTFYYSYRRASIGVKRDAL